MSQEYQKNELVYSKRTPHLKGVFLRDGVGKYQNLVEVACNDRLYYYPKGEIKSNTLMKKNIVAKCRHCSKIKAHRVNCKYTYCMICKYKYFDHRNMSCCLGPMQKYYQLKCTHCHALLQMFEGVKDTKEYLQRKLEKGCLKGLMKLRYPAPPDDCRILGKHYLSDQTAKINKIIGASL